MAETNWGADFINDCFGQNKSKEIVMPDLNEQLRAEFEAARHQGAFKPALDICPTWYATELRFEGFQAARRQHGSAAQAVKPWEVRLLENGNMGNESYFKDQELAEYRALSRRPAAERAASAIWLWDDKTERHVLAVPLNAAEPDGTLTNEGTMPAAAGNALTDDELAHRIAERLVKYGVQTHSAIYTVVSALVRAHRAAPQAAQGEGLTIDTPEFRDLLDLWDSADSVASEERVMPKITAYLNRAIAAHTRASDGLGAVREAVTDYYRALDNRQHGGVAQNNAFAKIEEALGMSWSAHREAMQQAASNQQEGAK